MILPGRLMNMIGYNKSNLPFIELSNLIFVFLIF